MSKEQVERKVQLVKESSVTNFGLLIAFLLPGFVALWGISHVSDPVRSWFGASPGEAPTVGGFFYVTLASIVAGMAASTVRWMTIDTIHHVTGVPRPSWDFSRLQENVAAFDMLNELYYRYYQFYANMVVAILVTVLLRHVAAPAHALELDAIDGAAALLTLVFFAGSRDSLRKYYRRGEQLLGRRVAEIKTTGYPNVAPPGIERTQALRHQLRHRHGECLGQPLDVQ